MQFDVVTIFPDIFTSTAFKGVVGQAILDQKICLNCTDLRRFSDKKYKQIDDRPFGGGDGMVYCPEPLTKAVASIKRHSQCLAVYLSPQGHLLNQDLATDLSQRQQLILVCGRYGGIDERVICNVIDLELSIGDYVLSGGELAAMVVIDVIVRLQKGILGNRTSSQRDSFSQFSKKLLEAPQFTRPRIFKNWSVPDVLVSGHHQEIESWKKKIAILRTFFRRPHLISSNVSIEERDAAKKLFLSMSEKQREVCGLPKNAKDISLLNSINLTTWNEMNDLE